MEQITAGRLTQAHVYYKAFEKMADELIEQRTRIHVEKCATRPVFVSIIKYLGFSVTEGKEQFFQMPHFDISGILNFMRNQTVW